MPLQAVELAKKMIDGTLLVVGGGIRSADAARERVEAGADGIVVGTIAEKEPMKAIEILEAVKKR